MSNNLKKQALANDLEEAFKNYLGTDSFPTDEWAAVARDFAEVIATSGDINSWNETDLNVATARDLVADIGRLTLRLSQLVGL
jgi:hypothetical protein